MFIDPIALSIFGFNIYWYAIAYAVSSIIIYFRSLSLINNYSIDISRNSLGDLLAYCALGVVVGGKVGFLFYDFQVAFFFKPYGFAFFGGFIGVLIALIIFAYINDLNMQYILLYSDVIISSLPIGIFLVRVANFINGECLGLTTDSILGTSYNFSGEVRHPTQLYEAFTEGLLLLVILNTLLYYKNEVIYSSGLITSLFLILYSIFRFTIEFYKDEIYYNEIYLNQLGCGMVFVFGVLIFSYNRLYVNRR